MSATHAYFIGLNCYGEAGIGRLGNSYDKPQLISKSIDRVFTGDLYNIYCDKDFTNIYSAGINQTGQCAIMDKEFISELRSINNFKQNGIKISQICCNVTGSHIYFISFDGKLYASGDNQQAQLGWNVKELKQKNSHGHTQIFPREIPELIPAVTNVIDVKSNGRYCVALCGIHRSKLKMIINGLFQSNGDKIIPTDILYLIIRFYEKYSVYSSIPYKTRQDVTHSLGTGHKYSCQGQCDSKIKDKYGWHKIDTFATKDVNITKIAVGHQCTLFMADTGTVWTAGCNKHGRPGLGGTPNGSRQYKYGPRKIKTLKKTRIIDVECGMYHSMVLAVDGMVYTWGRNENGQCGNGGNETETVYEPYFVESLKEYVIDKIKCGYQHNYCKSRDGKHFMWGSNQHSECLKKKKKDVSSPYNIDSKLGKYIKSLEYVIDICLGRRNTIILCRSSS